MSMTVTSQPLAKVVRAFSVYWPMVFVLPFYWVICGLASFFILTLFIPEDVARPYAWLAGSVLLIALVWGYLRFLWSVFSRYQIELSDGHLSIVGSPGWRVHSNDLELEQLDRIVLGDELSKFERISASFHSGSSSLLGDIKAGTLVFVRKNTHPIKVTFADKVFDQSRLEELLAALQSRGVPIERGA